MRVILYGLIGLTSGVSIAAERPARDARAMEEAVAVQVLLDRANFGPGKIDGHYGDFTTKALERYRRAKGGGASAVVAQGQTSRDAAAQAGTSQSSTGAPRSTSSPSAATALPEPDPKSLPSTSTAGPEAARERKHESVSSAKADSKSAKNTDSAPKQDVSDLDLKSIGDVFVDYTVTDADVQSVGELPEKPDAKAKLKWLPYATVAEAVAERFHMDVDFLEELNPGKSKNLRAGDVVRVPNVEPFDLANVKNLKPGTPLSAKGANAEEPAADAGEEQGDTKKKEVGVAQKGGKQKEKGKNDKDANEETQSAPNNLSVVVNKNENMLDVMEGDRLVAAFPVTVGSSETASPVGEWKVKGVAKLPEFRWDEKMLKEGERSSDFHLLPPGPNSPVGVIWIALNKKGVGLHGSDNPDAIGRNVSHGCIRLANWDVLRLATMVKTGVPVSIR